ncbi:hypothetical protein KCP76_03380 [Salmonella enterica subsp. enterica serovar Weltevreden]|nr:hypothetical protein KCP76_03380 [Salmonella enterica subsp. enterica serovar Weltevreden]
MRKIGGIAATSTDMGKKTCRSRFKAKVAVVGLTGGRSRIEQTPAALNPISVSK